MKVFKIRCSAIGHIMTEPKSAITENQLNQIKELEQKKNRTEKQEEKLKELIERRDNKELSQTAKSYCEDWLKSQIYGRKLEFTNKYTEKGIIMEDESIDFISKMLDYGQLFKNTVRHENNYMTGETDIEIPKNHDLVMDVKNSWSWETFPLFEKEIPNKNYWWQGQGYMELTGRKHYKLIYVLSDTPDHIIRREASNYSFYNGYGDLDPEIYLQFHKKLTYKDVEDKLKIKIFDFDRDEEAIIKINERVMMCRKYINELSDQMNFGTDGM